MSTGKPRRTDTTAKVDVTLLRKAKMIAAHRDLGLSEYLDGLIRNQIEKDYDKMVKNLTQGQKDEG